MEVTKSNFEEVFPDIVRDITHSTFLCIDGEFTGLNNGHNVNAFDTPAESYNKIRAGSMDFLFIQFGLSIFTQDEKTGRYKNKTYVFYLFPRPINRLAPDSRFLCQTSSIDFLVSNNFDFNKLFREGIPYLNASDESQLAEAMEIKRNYKSAQVKDTPSSQTIPIPKQHKSSVDAAIKKIDEVVNGKQNEAVIDNCSAFVRKLIYQSFEEKYKNIEGIILKTEGGRMLCQRGQQEVMEEKDAKELAAAVGFSRVVREISAKGKLVVGHNMLLDVCHLIQRFLDPLPDDYYEFKEMLHTLFPQIIDTKLIAAEESIKQIINGSTLVLLMESISKPPFHLPCVDSEDGYSLTDVKYHDAGYDAFITGTVFLSLVRSLDPDNKFSNVKNCKPIQKYMNKLYLQKAPDTCMDLVNLDPEPSRDHVFHLSFPKHWNANNIQKLFSPYGPIQLFWLSNTTAWVSLVHREESPKVVRGLENSSNLPSGITVLSYKRFVSEKGAAISPRPNKRKHGNEGVGDVGKRKKNLSNDVRSNGNRRKISPIPEETSNSDSEMKKLEESANIVGCEFDIDQSWN